MYNHNKAQQSKNRVHISWDILYVGRSSCVSYVLHIHGQNVKSKICHILDQFLPHNVEKNIVIICGSRDIFQIRSRSGFNFGLKDRQRQNWICFREFSKSMFCTRLLQFDFRYKNNIANYVKWKHFDHDDISSDATAWFWIMTFISMLKRKWIREQILRPPSWEQTRISQSYF